MIDPVPDYPSAPAPPLYYPCLAGIPANWDLVEAMPLVGAADHDLALPTSVLWIGPGE